MVGLTQGGSPEGHGIPLEAGKAGPVVVSRLGEGLCPAVDV